MYPRVRHAWFSRRAYTNIHVCARAPQERRIARREKEEKAFSRSRTRTCEERTRMREIKPRVAHTSSRFSRRLEGWRWIRSFYICACTGIRGSGYLSFDEFRGTPIILYTVCPGVRRWLRVLVIGDRCLFFGGSLSWESGRLESIRFRL